MTQNRRHVEMAEAWCNALAGDPKPARDLLDHGSLLHVPGDTGLAGQYQGGEAILSLVDRLKRITDGTLRCVPNRVLGATTHTILWGHMNADQRGSHLETDTVHVFSLEDGNIREIWMFFGNQDLVDRFWAQES